MGFAERKVPLLVKAVRAFQKRISSNWQQTRVPSVCPDDWWEEKCAWALFVRVPGIDYVS